jgi:hypothetical protein
LHSAIVFQIGKERRCRWLPFTGWHTALDNPRHRLTVVVEE